MYILLCYKQQNRGVLIEKSGTKITESLNQKNRKIGPNYAAQCKLYMD